MKLINPKNIAYLELLALAVIVGLFLWWIYPSPLVTTGGKNIIADTRPAIVFENIPTEAKSVYVYDILNKEELYGKNESLQLPLASLTKIMTAFTASTLLPSNSLISISLDDLQTEGDSGLYADEVWSIGKLIDFSLLVSSNDGASALASVAGARVAYDQTKTPRELFIIRMNTLAKEIGLEQTYFLNPSGLDESTYLSGGYGSAKDMAILISHIVETKPHLLEATSFYELALDSKFKTHIALNTNKVVENIPNVLASKTGFTDLSGGNLVIAFDAGLNHPVVVSIIGSSIEGRFTDMEAMVKETLNYLAKKAERAVE